jgi:molybdate transport system substrate-binding protein
MGLEEQVMRAARSRGGAVKALIFGLVLASSIIPAHAGDVVVFAAASLKNALDDAVLAWKQEAGKSAVISYAASNVLAKQIEAGAPADIFFSADLDWMDYAASKELIRPETRTNLLGNSLVLIAPKDSGVRIPLQPGLDLAPFLGKGRLAMGQLAAVPAGKYGKAALEKLGAWNGVKDKVAQTENVRAALLLVARGEAPLGIVYQTDAMSEARVTIVGTFPEGSHPLIVYPVAMTKDSNSPDAASLLNFLRSERARPLFEKQGFTVVNAAGSGS